MLKSRDLGINIIPAMMPPPGETYDQYMVPYPDMGGSAICPDMSCRDVYRKPTKKAPSKKKTSKKPSKKPANKPTKKPSKKGYRASGFGAAATAQLGRELEEQLRDIH